MTPRPIATVVIPVKLVSEANQREHWAQKHKRKKSQQALCYLQLSSTFSPKAAENFGPVAGVWLTRIIPTRGRSMDADNLAGSFKHVQDAVAMWLGVDDANLKWSYAQERGHVAGVRVEVWGEES
jgi:hypothetical protein